MIKTILVDDEYNARESLEKLLSRYFPNKFLILSKCRNIDEAVESIKHHKPDLVFLDIQMPDKSGFELFSEIQEITFEVIFTTAHAEFAMQAIKQSALDYLLKPIHVNELILAVKRYENKIHKATELNKFSLLLENLDTNVNEFKKIAFPVEDGYELVKTSSILYCIADSNYCTIVCLDGKKIILSKTLKYVEELLPTNIFQRVHKSYLVNLNYISKFQKINDLKIELANGEVIPVSIRQKQNLINAINQKK
jgi:two-component system LytT family response regulator